jgi:hypothetical protein
VAELVDAPDSKSGDGDIVSVRFRPSVPDYGSEPCKEIQKPASHKAWRVFLRLSKYEDAVSLLYLCSWAAGLGWISRATISLTREMPNCSGFCLHIINRDGVFAAFVGMRFSLPELNGF